MQNVRLVTTQSFNEGSLDTRDKWYFLACSGEISVEVIGRRRHCKQLCGGMEMPCQLELQMKRLKELLAGKIWV